MIVAIDGPAGAGKSTVAKALAARLRFTYIDTGAMYRAATLVAMRFDIPFDNGKRIIDTFKTLGFHFLPPEDSARRQRVFFGDEDISSAIRTPELTRKIRIVCAQPEVRDHMTELQRDMGNSSDSVLEGRDIGTVVFPNAECKFYMDAAVTVRAKRRHSDLLAAGSEASLDDLAKEIEARDASDMNRDRAPLKQAHDAQRIDTSDMTIDEVIDCLASKVQEKMTTE